MGMKKLTIEPQLKPTQKDVIVEWMKWSGVLDTKLVDFLNANTEESERCDWDREGWDSDCWGGSCGITWVVYEGTPEENGMNYCPRCGRKLIQNEWETEEEWNAEGVEE